MSQGVFAQNDSSIRRIVSPHLAIWARSDEEKLALTEMDIEGWIRLASLCREVQGGTPLKMSVASSEQIYRTLSAEFDGLKRDDQLGRVAVGPFWPEVEAHWKSASYEQQQAWIRVTPLPPPMTATSRAYVDAVLELPPGKMSDVLHQVLGPFGLR